MLQSWASRVGSTLIHGLNQLARRSVLQRAGSGLHKYIRPFHGARISGPNGFRPTTRLISTASRATELRRLCHRRADLRDRVTHEQAPDGAWTGYFALNAVDRNVAPARTGRSVHDRLRIVATMLLQLDEHSDESGRDDPRMLPPWPRTAEP